MLLARFLANDPTFFCWRRMEHLQAIASRSPMGEKQAYAGAIHVAVSCEECGPSNAKHSKFTRFHLFSCLFIFSTSLSISGCILPEPD